MTCGTEWNLDFSRKIPPDFTERRSSGWIRYSHNGLSALLRPLDRIFDIWHEVTGVQLEVWSVPLEVAGGGGPFSPAGFIEWWEIRYCGLKKGDPARNSGSRQAPIGGFTGRAKHFVNSEILTTSETMTFCQQIEQEQNANKKNRSKRDYSKINIYISSVRSSRHLNNI